MVILWLLILCAARTAILRLFSCHLRVHPIPSKILTYDCRPFRCFSRQMSSAHISSIKLSSASAVLATDKGAANETVRRPSLPSDSRFAGRRPAFVPHSRKPPISPPKRRPFLALKKSWQTAFRNNLSSHSFLLIW